MTQNQIAYWNLQELKRSNLAKEAENYRSHRATEDIGYIGANEEIRHNQVTEHINWANLEEQARHNTVSENETIRSNQTREEETMRHNIATEGLGGKQIGLGYSQLSENARQFDWSYPIELQRGNAAQLTAEAAMQNANLRMEELGVKGFEASTAAARQEEEARHNVEMEKLEAWKIVSGFTTGMGNVVSGFLRFAK